MIDLYCERTGPGPWAEPFNTLTNLSFIIAAVFAWKLARQRKVGGVSALIGLAVAIGIGSALWHIFATPEAIILDVGPIVIFQIIFTWLYGRRVVGLKPRGAAAVLLVDCDGELNLRP